MYAHTLVKMADILFISLQAMDRSVPQKYSRFFFFFFFFFLSTYRERGAEFLCGVAIDLIKPTFQT